MGVFFCIITLRHPACEKGEEKVMKPIKMLNFFIKIISIPASVAIIVFVMTGSGAAISLFIKIVCALLLVLTIAWMIFCTIAYRNWFKFLNSRGLQSEARRLTLPYILFMISFVAIWIPAATGYISESVNVSIYLLAGLMWWFGGTRLTRIIDPHLKHHSPSQ